MPHKDANKIAQRIADADKVINEFKYRQAFTLTKFETLYSKKGSKLREQQKSFRRAFKKMECYCCDYCYC